MIDGPKIEALRKERRMSRRMLANVAGVTEKTMYSIEKTRGHEPRAPTIQIIAEALDVAVDELVTANGPTRTRREY